MKRVISFIMAILMLSTLCGCKREEAIGYETPEALINAYLQAVANKDYDGIWDMIPPAIQDYAIEEGIIKDKEDGLDYIKFAINDYFGQFDANLIAQESYDYEIENLQEENVKYAQDYINAELEPTSNRLVIEDGVYIESVIVTLNDGSTVDSSFSAIKTDGQWYITSVVGDDELFEY